MHRVVLCYFRLNCRSVDLTDRICHDDDDVTVMMKDREMMDGDSRESEKNRTVRNDIDKSFSLYLLLFVCHMYPACYVKLDFEWTVTCCFLLSITPEYRTGIENWIPGHLAIRTSFLPSPNSIFFSFFLSFTTSPARRKYPTIPTAAPANDDDITLLCQRTNSRLHALPPPLFCCIYSQPMLPSIPFFSSVLSVLRQHTQVRVIHYITNQRILPYFTLPEEKQAKSVVNKVPFCHHCLTVKTKEILFVCSASESKSEEGKEKNHHETILCRASISVDNCTADDDTVAFCRRSVSVQCQCTES